MVSSRALKEIIRNPRAMMEFRASGRVPVARTPQGPLYALLKQIAPRDLARCTGVLVDARLGYTGSRRFHYGSQAMQWIAPAPELFSTWPAESWRDKRFAQSLYLEDFIECCAQVPADLTSRYPRLCRPKPSAAP